MRGTTETGRRGSPRSYDVLPAGREQLRTWVGEPGVTEGPRTRRDALMLRMRAAGVVGVEGLLPELRRQLVEHRAALASYEEIQERDFGAGAAGAAGADEQAARLQHLVLRAGIGVEQHWVAWLTTALSELEPPQEPGREGQDNLVG